MVVKLVEWKAWKLVDWKACMMVGSRAVWSVDSKVGQMVVLMVVLMVEK